MTKKIQITGIVQGVGFRPFVYNLANSHKLNGFVLNDSSGVTIVIQGQTDDIHSFENKLKKTPPPRSKIVSCISKEIESKESFGNFSIRLSPSGGKKSAAVSPDLDVCPECLNEMLDPDNRRYLYPFINCTNCGPRYTIIQDIPYDRPKTTMSEFKMCAQCQSEYDDPSNRRFHAQPNACPECGPQLTLLDSNQELIQIGGSASENQLLYQKVAELFNSGKIIAVKGLGGFHLACDATSEAAVSLLRKRKYREDKPFAVMFPNIDVIKKYCGGNNLEISLLQSVAHPIVLLKKVKKTDLAASIAPNNHFLGAMLPYTPLHHLIFQYFDRPLVMTSGNVSDEPIVYKNKDVFRRLGKIADYFLINDREIHIRCDDSVYRIWNNKPYPIRRSRGYAPDKIMVDRKFDSHVLACGPEQKNTFALAKDNAVYLSHHIGDMENIEVLKSLEEGVAHYKHIFDIEPEIIAYDLHPDYLSTKYAEDYPDINSNNQNIHKVGVQHHHAHAVSCMVENGINQPVLAIVLDGTGYGTDGTIWGGELLLAEFDRFERLGHFQTTRLPGGTAAIKNPWQMGISYLQSVFDDRLVDIPFIKNLDSEKIKLVLTIMSAGLNSPITSSCGRLFDGVAAVAGLRNQVNYEGQAAVEFEQCIRDEYEEGYKFPIINEHSKIVLKWDKMVHQLVKDVEKQISISIISQKFHNGLSDGLMIWVSEAQKQTGIKEIVLSGGVFMNYYLLTRLKNALEKKGFIVYTHSVVPCNDGGISLGQAVIAGAQLKKMETE
ncbi:MAG TPA: carbamoyltransferase HypF [Candidatus Marinimicrobia bacterium]|nr:carbamoyltransferase HypF [Candidatus Neomarinimicrobiota bacterium]